MSRKDEAEIRRAIEGRSGEVRINCPFPDCTGSQEKTLGVNADTGKWHCHRCDRGGNIYGSNGGGGERLSKPEWIWQNSKACHKHPYLTKKGVNAYGLRVDKHGSLVVPYSKNGEASTLQFIKPSGDKLFLKDHAAKGAYFQVGGGGDTIYVCEGYATGASIHEATGGLVFIVGFAGNLKPASENIARLHPGKRLVFCSDNDAHGKGRQKADEAARAVGGLVCMPEQAGMDFNDLHQQHGLEAVREAISKTAAPPETGPTAPGATPEPLPDELLPVASFDFTLLPDALRPWAEDICDRMQCPPDFVAAGIMAALAGVIGRKVAIRPQARTDWTVTCNIWALIVGRPGDLKSPALEQAPAPVKRFAAIAADRYQQAETEYQAEALAAKLKKEAAEKQAKETLKKNPNADLLAVLAVDEPAAPQLKRYVANDTSPASLGELLRQNPNGLLVFRDEIVSLLKGLDREGQEEGRGFYLTAWNGDSSYTFDRIGRGLNLHIPAVCLSVLGGTQPGRLSEYIRQAVKGGAADDGLIQRFGLLVWPDTGGKWKDVDRWPDTEAKNKAFRLFEYLDNMDPLEIGAEQGTDFDGNPDGPPFLRFEPAALEAFQEWRTNLERRLRGELHPALESHFAKYRKLIPAISLICHLADGSTGPVTEKSTLRALAWGEYLESHAQRAYGSVSQPEIAVAKAILRRIKKGDLPESFSSRDVWRPGWAKLTDRDQVKEALRLLEDYNWITRERIEGTGGRPKTIFHVSEQAKL